jgi:hypothetical protein
VEEHTNAAEADLFAQLAKTVFAFNLHHRLCLNAWGEMYWRGEWCYGMRQ